LWAAKDLELFRKHGLKAEMVLITGSTLGMAALISRSSDLPRAQRARRFPSVCAAARSPLSPRRSTFVMEFTKLSYPKTPCDRI
jgi:hypothetical protein